MSRAIKPRLLNDTAVRIGTAVFLAVILPVVMPLLYTGTTGHYSRFYVDLPILVMTIASIQYRLQCVEDRTERRFWHLWSLGILVWLVQVVLVLVTDSEVNRSVEFQITVSLFFYVFYVCLALALESQPHVPAVHISNRMRLFNGLGVITFFLGLLLYFIIVPRMFDPESALRSSWVFYIVFDIYLLVRLGGFIRVAGDRRWRRIYAWLLVAILALFLSDSFGLAMSTGIIGEFEQGPTFDPLLLFSFLAILISGRSREVFRSPPDNVVDEKPDINYRPEGQLGPLVIYAMMFPLMHFAVAKTGLLNPALVPIRENLVLLFLALLSILAYVVQRLVLTENQRLEYERLETTRALQQSESRFRSAFENITTGSVVINSRGIIESINSMAQSIFGYTLEEVAGKNVRMLMPESFAIEHDGYLQHYKETGKSGIIGTGREVSGLRKNGEEFPMHLGIGEMAVEGGNSYIGSITDLTQLKSMEQQLMRTQKMEAVGQLTGGVAHDFNNILSIILGNVELLELQVQADDESAKCLGAIRKSAERAAELTQKLLIFSGSHPVRVTIIDINRLVAEMEGLIARSLTPEVSIEQQLAGNLWYTEINAGDLEDALVNLVLNARDAMAGGGTLTLATHNRIFDEDYCARNPGVEPGEFVELAVSDTGEGISPEQQQHIFEPFYTTKDTGTGLGLAMVYGFTKRSGGHLKVSSEIGAGTTIRLCLPRAVARRPVQESVDGETNVLPRGSSQTLLVVDDEEALLDFARTQLEGLGYRVLVAGNGRQALTVLADEQRIDLLFSDIVMPGSMNGYELAEQATAIYPGLKVLLVSGYEQNVRVPNNEIRMTANLLTKPYTLAELAKRVRAIMDDTPRAV